MRDAAREGRRRARALKHGGRGAGQLFGLHVPCCGRALPKHPRDLSGSLQAVAHLRGQHPQVRGCAVGGGSGRARRLFGRGLGVSGRAPEGGEVKRSRGLGLALALCRGPTAKALETQSGPTLAQEEVCTCDLAPEVGELRDEPEVPGIGYGEGGRKACPQTLAADLVNCPTWQDINCDYLSLSLHGFYETGCLKFPYAYQK